LHTWDFAFASADRSNIIGCSCNRGKLGQKCWFTKDVVTHYLMFNRRDRFSTHAIIKADPHMVDKCYLRDCKM